MDTASLLTFAGVLFVVAALPGPNIGALVARVLICGCRGVWSFVLGLWIGDAFWLTLAVFGVAAIANMFYTAFLILKWAGILYLVFLAWKMWMSPVEHHEGDRPLTRDKEAGKLFMSALAVTLGNPKIMVFYLAVLPTIIDISEITIIDWLEMLTLMFLILAPVYGGWIVLAAQARRLLRNPRAMRIANRTSAGLMASVAAALAAQ